MAIAKGSNAQDRMTNTEIAIADQPTSKPLSRQAIQAKTASKPRRVTGKLAIACKAIAWEGQELDEAAKAAGLTTRALRVALERPHVLAFLKEQREVFRAYVSSQNIRKAKDLRDTSKNSMAVLGAMKYIDNVADDAMASAARQRAPGVVIVIGSDAALTAHQPQIEAKPLIDHAPVSHGGADDD